MKKLILSSIITTITLLLVVVFYGNIKSLITGGNIGMDSNYTCKQILFGILAESIRALLINWLYINHDSNKSLLSKALVFGIACSLLVGSIWILLGIEFLDISHRLSFVIDDSIILFLQGILSGFVLWIMYKDEANAK